MTVQAVVFDMDGLMVDSEPLALEAWQRSLAPFGARLTDHQYRCLIGIGHADSVRRVLAHTGAPLTYEELDERFWQHLFALAETADLRPMPGLLPLLDDLQSRGFPLGIASNSPTEYVHRLMGRIGVAGRFTSLVGADQVQQPKPAPDVYLEAARRLGVEPSRCLAFEDSPSGRRAAQAAGMRCVFVPNYELGMAPAPDASAGVYPSLEACRSALEDILRWASGPPPS
ncbi:MAG: HAD family phosphatase [Anaerolineae bacterium]